LDVFKSGSTHAAATASDNPIILRFDFDTGHRAQETMSSLASSIADRYSFICGEDWIPNFQPKPKKGF
jgi:protease II